MVNVVPAPGCDCTSMVPPAFWTMLWLMARPRPVPCVLVVKKGTKRLRSTLGAMPGPVSRTLTSTCCSISSVSERRDDGRLPSSGGTRPRADRLRR